VEWQFHAADVKFEWSISCSVLYANFVLLLVILKYGSALYQTKLFETDFPYDKNYLDNKEGIGIGI